MREYVVKNIVANNNNRFFIVRVNNLLPVKLKKCLVVFN